MKRIVVTLFLLAFSSSLLAATTSRYIVATRGNVANPKALLMIRDVASEDRPARDVMSFRFVDGFAADLTADEVAALRRSASVRFVEPVEERHAYDLGATESTGDVSNPFAQVVPFGLDMVRAREVWPVTRGEGINVVVVDTGIDATHPDLAKFYQGGYNTYTKTDKPVDDNGHGTHVSGTIAAADNNIGVVGVAPNVKLWAVKVLDASGSGTSDKIIAAVDWVLAKQAALGGRWVLNFSLGASRASTLEREAFGRAVDAGLLIIAASGNESTATSPAPVGYPAAYRDVLAIGAVDDKKAIASFSDQGPQLAVVAPGVGVLSSVRAGSGSAAGVNAGTTNYPGSSLAGGARGVVTGHFVDCGYGSAAETPASVRGNIALIQRGNGLYFYEKARNAKEAGATAVVIYNNGGEFTAFTLISQDQTWTSSYNFPVVIMLQTADGQALRGNSNQEITVTSRADDYDVFSGTSMATPHAVGVAALVWSLAPELKAATIRAAIDSTADDLGTNGFDNVFGNGLVDALSAAKSVAPARFGTPVSDPPSPPANKRHSARH